MTVTVNGLPFNASQATDFRSAIGLDAVTVNGSTTTIAGMVQHRTGTKAALLGVTGAPVGEIAVPTDENSLVVYKAGGPVTLVDSSSAATQIVDTTGTVSGAFAATISGVAKSVHVKIPAVSAADITLTLPAAATVGTTITISGDAMLSAAKTIAVRSVSTDFYSSSTLAASFNPVEQLTLGYLQVADVTGIGVVKSWVVLGREQVVSLVSDVANNEGNYAFVENSFGVAGGIVRGEPADSQAAIGKGTVSFAQAAVAIGMNVQAGHSVANGTGALAVGNGINTTPGPAMPNGTMQVLYENSSGFGTPNTENRNTAYIRVGSHGVAHSFTLRRTSVNAAATELTLNGSAWNSVSSPSGANSSNRFTFVRNGIYTFEMDAAVRIPGTTNAYFIKKQFSVLKDATGGVAFIGSPETIGTPQKNGFAANITADPFSFSLGGTSNVNLICTFDAQAATDSSGALMTVQACFRGFIALA